MTEEPTFEADRGERQDPGGAPSLGRSAVVPRILIVSALFSPSRRIGAQRPARIASGLAERGWDVSVLTLHPRYMEPLDRESTPRASVRVLRTSAVRPAEALRNIARGIGRLLPSIPSRRDEDRDGSRPFPEDRDGIPLPAEAHEREFGLASFKRWAARRVASLEFPDKWMGWLPLALLAARGRSFDVVMATLPPYTPALIARAIARRTGARLVLDYRDPWTEAPRRDWGAGWHAALRERHRRLEDSCLGAATLVVGVSPTLCKMLEARFSGEVLLVPNSYDAAAPSQSVGRDPTTAAPGTDAAPSRPPAKAGRLVYAGSLAYGRSLGPLIVALARLDRERGAHGLKLIYAGPDGAQVRRMAADLGAARLVEDLGSLEGSRVRALLQGATAGVVAVSRDYEYQYPGKIFEILAAGSPILLIAGHGSDAAQLVRRHSLGWAHDPQDVEGIMESLLSALAGDVPSPVDLERLRTSHALETLDRALRKLL